MSLYPIIWAAEHAPVRDAEERAILMALVIKADFDGCNAFRSYKRLAIVARCDPKTAERRCKAMAERGVIRRQPGPKPQAWKDLPRDKKTVVWEAMIPASFWSAVQLAEINDTRAERRRPPITSKNRPDLPEAPPKKTRADKGKPRPERRKKKPEQQERGDYKSPRSEEGTPESGGTTSPLAGGLQVPSRGDYESINPPLVPSASPSSPLVPPQGGDADPASGDTTGREEEIPTNNTNDETEGDTAPQSQQAPDDHQARLEHAQTLVDGAVRLWPTEHRAPSPRDRQRLCERVVAELEAGGDDTVIVYELSRDLRDAGSAVKVIMGSRTKTPGWGQAHDPRPDQAQHQIKTRVPWCGAGACDERTRLTLVYVEATGETQPKRCRTPVTDPTTGETVACHPKATPRPEVVQDDKIEEIPAISAEEIAAMMRGSLDTPKASTAELLAAARESFGPGADKALGRKR